MIKVIYVRNISFALNYASHLDVMKSIITHICITLWRMHIISSGFWVRSIPKNVSPCTKVSWGKANQTDRSPRLARFNERRSAPRFAVCCTATRRERSSASSMREGVCASGKILSNVCRQVVQKRIKLSIPPSPWENSNYALGPSECTQWLGVKEMLPSLPCFPANLAITNPPPRLSLAVYYLSRR